MGEKNMKKLIYIFIPILVISFYLCSCNINYKNSKPQAYYYTNSLIKAMNKDNDYECYAIDTNYYKKIVLTGESLTIVRGFIKCIKTDNFIADPKLTKDPPYKIYFRFKNQKYIINIYDEKYVSIYPYDGIYPMDYLNCSNVYKFYNLYSLMNILYLR